MTNSRNFDDSLDLVVDEETVVNTASFGPCAETFVWTNATSLGMKPRTSSTAKSSGARDQLDNNSALGNTHLRTDDDGSGAVSGFHIICVGDKVD